MIIIKLFKSTLRSAEIRKPWISATLASVLMILFILLFQPLDYNLLSVAVKARIITIVGIGTLLFCMAHHWLAVFVAQFTNRSAMVEVSIWLGLTLIFSQIIYWYTIYSGLNAISWNGSFTYMASTATLSIVPLLAVKTIRAATVGTKISHSIFSRNEANPKTLTVDGNPVLVEDIILVKAEDNYTRIFQENGHQGLIRKTLQNVEKALQQHPQFLRVHRSYFLNLDGVVRVSGNSKRCKVELRGLDFEIPIARSKIKLFNQKFLAMKD